MTILSPPIALVLFAAGLGMRHAVAPDHLAAVGSFIKGNDASPRQGIGYALRIGLGHAVGMTTIALLALAVLHTLPRPLTLWLTRLSGVWLIVLACAMLFDLAKHLGIDPRNPPVKNEGGIAASYPRKTSRLFVRWTRRLWAAWAVGLLFGVAVSPGDLAIFSMVMTQSGHLTAAVTLLGVFVFFMLVALAIVGFALGLTASDRNRIWHVWLTGLSSIFGLGVGVGLVTGFLH